MAWQYQKIDELGHNIACVIASQTESLHHHSATIVVSTTPANKEVYTHVCRPRSFCQLATIPRKTPRKRIGYREKMVGGDEREAKLSTTHSAQETPKEDSAKSHSA